MGGGAGEEMWEEGLQGEEGEKLQSGCKIVKIIKIICVTLLCFPWKRQKGQCPKDNRRTTGYGHQRLLIISILSICDVP